MRKNLRLIWASALIFLSGYALAQSSGSDEILLSRALQEKYSDYQDKDFAELSITKSFENPRTWIKYIYASQAINGVRIDNSYITAALNSNGEVVHITANLVRGIAKKSPPAEPGLGLIEAVSVHLDPLLPGLSVAANSIGDNKTNLVLEAENYLHKTTAEKVFYYTGEEELRLAWVFDAEMPSGAHWYHYTVDAQNGSLLNKHDWTVSCTHDHHSAGTHRIETAQKSIVTPLDGSGYRVLQFPVESPNHGERSLASQPGVESASPYGWHDVDGSVGAEFTITRGNNVYAYEDFSDSNTPGFSPNGGSDLQFDYEYDPTALPENYQSAAITNLFYANNRIHDILVSYGFDEASGNFQNTNYSGAGGANDFVRAEAQDGGGTNNANMATPPDGQNPRMQMYLWNSAPANTELLTVNSPATVEGTYASSAPAAFGPGIPAEGITADLVLMLDASGTEDDGCEPAVNGAELNGNIALVYRGNCNFTDKVISAQNAGALACIVINNQGGIIEMGGNDPNVAIPSIMINQAIGNSLVAQLELGNTVNGTLNGTDGSNILDGSFDNGIIVHEYIHGLTNRLTGGSANSNCLGNEEQMGEGWSDWYAMMMTMDMESENPVYRPIGTFAINEPTDGVGIRPTAYDTSFSVNGFTYASVSNANLSVPHGVGFVWSTMLWDLTWALINEYGFDENLETGAAGNNVAMNLVTEALKLQICQPGFVDGRDAILMADEILYDGANQCLIWSVFAKRGLGFNADQGSSQSRSDGTADFDLPPLCQNVTSAPIAAFSASTDQTCNGIVQFTDESTEVPQAWFWDFGDGNNSDEQNPLHIYENPGQYTVSLTVTNTQGEDIAVANNLINFSIPQSPTVSNGAGCEGEVILLQADADGGAIEWLDEDGDMVGEGPNFEVVMGQADQNYSAVQVVEEFEPVFVGPDDENFGTGGNHATEFIGTIIFNAEQPLTIVSAYVVSGAIAPRTITLWEGTPEAGNIVDQVTVNVDFVGGGRIDLNFDIDLPGSYSMGLSQANFYRNDTGANYPYEASDVLTITGSPAGPEFYYYFYDLEVTSRKCQSEPVPVVAVYEGSAAFTAAANGLEVSFTDQSAMAQEWLWNFGDGNTSTLQNPVHTYAEEGVYTVSLTTSESCTFTDEVNLIISSIDESTVNAVSFLPNPANDFITINTSKIVAGNLQVFNVEGRLILQQVLNRSGESTVNISGLPAGVFILSLKDNRGELLLRERLVVVK